RHPRRARDGARDRGARRGRQARVGRARQAGAPPRLAVGARRQGLGDDHGVPERGEEGVTTSRIERTFARLASARKKALVAYLCVGDPSVDESVELAVAAANAGADILELGVPFSDPTADGPAIARASLRAIAAGATLEAVIGAAARVRARVEVPIVL